MVVFAVDNSMVFALKPNMTMLNQAHVEAICSATYLENYLDCVDSLPDELQRILTQMREIDVKIRGMFIYFMLYFLPLL